MADYIGKHEPQEVYDGILAELLTDKEIRVLKYMRTHEVRNDGHPVLKDKRKSYRKEKCYQCDPWNGWDTYKNHKERIAIKTRMADFRAELRMHEDAIAEYYDLATWKQCHEKAKDTLLDEDITKTSIGGIYIEIAYENARIDQLNTEMLNILKGECY